MKIGIFGGSFNPPHMKHKSIALDLISKGYVDRVIFVPAGDFYQKEGLIKGKDRYQMLRIMCSSNSLLDVSDYELLGGLTYTYQTLDYFQKLYPEDQIYFIMGEDNLKEIPSWKNSSYLLNNYYFLVISRDHKESLNLFSTCSHIIYTQVEESIISSTKIRDLLRNGESIEGYLDDIIYQYIKEKDLYL